ncbi:MAG TPA: DUF1565 domain-containing protein [bacterium]|nr:DUF1565 domain-containing protein [bacterium]
MKQSPTIILAVLLFCTLFAYSGCDCDDDDDPSTGSGQANDDDDDGTPDDDNDDFSPDDDDDDTTDDDDDFTPVDDDDDTPEDWPEQPPEPSNENGVFVAITGDDSYPGTMSKPKRTVQAGANLAAATGKVVFVAQGTYQENVTTAASLYGGYEAIGWTRNPRNYPTIIEAKEKTFAVRFYRETTLTVEGFGLTGKAMYDYENERINLFTVIINAGRVRLRDNIITTPDCLEPEAEMDVYSHGVAIHGGLARLERNTIITGKTGAFGYGILAPVFIDGLSQAQVIRNILIAQQGNFLATGVFVGYAAQATLINNVMRTAYSPLAVGMYALGDTLTLHNTLFPGTGQFAMGAWLPGGAHILGNNIIMSGTGIIEAYCLVTQTYLLPTFDLFGNDFYNQMGGMLINGSGDSLYTADEINACEWRECESAVGNIAQEPMLTGDYYAHLAEGSPCIDAGIDPTPWYDRPEVFYDFEGDARPSGAGWDIGMDEYIAARQP